MHKQTELLSLPLSITDAIDNLAFEVAAAFALEDPDDPRVGVLITHAIEWTAAQADMSIAMVAVASAVDVLADAVAAVFGIEIEEVDLELATRRAECAAAEREAARMAAREQRRLDHEFRVLMATGRNLRDLEASLQRRRDRSRQRRELRAARRALTTEIMPELGEILEAIPAVEAALAHLKSLASSDERRDLEARSARAAMGGMALAGEIDRLGARPIIPIITVRALDRTAIEDLRVLASVDREAAHHLDQVEAADAAQREAYGKWVDAASKLSGTGFQAAFDAMFGEYRRRFIDAAKGRLPAGFMPSFTTEQARVMLAERSRHALSVMTEVRRARDQIHRDAAAYLSGRLAELERARAQAEADLLASVDANIESIKRYALKSSKAAMRRAGRRVEDEERVFFSKVAWNHLKDARRERREAAPRLAAELAASIMAEL